MNKTIQIFNPEFDGKALVCASAEFDPPSRHTAARNPKAINVFLPHFGEHWPVKIFRPLIVALHILCNILCNAV